MSRSSDNRMEKCAPRFSFSAYNISQERYRELCNGCAAGKYSREILSKACRGLEFIKPWILLSVTKGKSYESLEKMWARGEIERVPYGKTDFYGFRRKFYHNLDVLLKGSTVHEAV